MEVKPIHPALKGGAGAATAAVIALAVAAVAPHTETSEGTVLHTYRDQGGVATYCTGETQNVDWARTYTKPECHALLMKRLAHDYAPGILKCVPAFADRKNLPAFEASIDGAFNAGIVGFCHSPMARDFNAGEWARGCDAFVNWRATIHGKPSKGLRNRREGERLLCLGLAR